MSRDIGACPDPSVIAAFVEQRLNPAERKEVTRHAAVCAECVTVIAETSRFLHAASHRRRTPSGWWLVAAAVAVIIAVPLLMWRARSATDLLRRTRMIAAAEPARSVEGRLHGFEYRPYTHRRSYAAETQSAISLRVEEERLAHQAKSGAASLHARGVTALLLGDERRAVALLAVAARTDGDEATYWTDLAAAQIVLGALTRNPDTFLEGMHAADRAIALEPRSSEAHFNRALAAEHLGRTSTAQAAYGRALALESHPFWRDELRRRIARISD